MHKICNKFVTSLIFKAKACDGMAGRAVVIAFLGENMGNNGRWVRYSSLFWPFLEMPVTCYLFFTFFKKNNVTK
jgi:hypothetical protein